MTFPKISFIFYKRCAIALFLFAALNILLGQFTNIDLVLADYYFNTSTHQFPWKDTWFAKDLMHGYVKYIITDVGYLLWFIVILDFIYPWRIIKQWLRIRLRFVAIASILIPTLVAILKHFSALHCPWDLTRYGGFAPFIRLFDHVPATMQAGACFPAGHATVALWLAALCVFWLPSKPKMALVVFLSGLGVGFALGWVQQMRGAHFLFHTLWAVWLTALVIFIMLGFSKQFKPQL